MEQAALQQRNSLLSQRLANALAEAERERNARSGERVEFLEQLRAKDIYWERLIEHFKQNATTRVQEGFELGIANKELSQQISTLLKSREEDMKRLNDLKVTQHSLQEEKEHLLATVQHLTERQNQEELKVQILTETLNKSAPARVSVDVQTSNHDIAGAKTGLLEIESLALMRNVYDQNLKLHQHRAQGVIYRAVLTHAERKYVESKKGMQVLQNILSSERTHFEKLQEQWRSQKFALLQSCQDIQSRYLCLAEHLSESFLATTSSEPLQHGGEPLNYGGNAHPHRGEIRTLGAEEEGASPKDLTAESKLRVSNPGRPSDLEVEFTPELSLLEEEVRSEIWNEENPPILSDNIQSADTADVHAVDVLRPSTDREHLSDVAFLHQGVKGMSTPSDIVSATALSTENVPTQRVDAVGIIRQDGDPRAKLLMHEETEEQRSEREHVSQETHLCTIPELTPVR